jgi:hypothetical protein
MISKIALWIEPAFFLFTFLVVIPLVAAVIGYAAWKGKPKSFGRDMYWTISAVASAAALGLGVYAQRMQADVRTWQYLLQLGCFGLGALLAGVALGCGVGILTYRRRTPPEEPPQ